MKVILLRDVAKIGRRFEIKEVPDGFALNKLIPQKMAEAATPANVKRISARQKSAVEHSASEKAGAETVSVASLREPLVITMEANEQGHLFQAVHAKDVVAVGMARGFGLEESQILIKSPIKALGAHTVELTAGGSTFPVAIVVTEKKK